MSAGTCQYCGCTEAEACDGGCSWADSTHTICSRCMTPADIAVDLVRILGSVLAPSRGLASAGPSFDVLPEEQRRVVVATCRAAVEAIRLALLEALTDDNLQAAVELNVIANFLLEKCPDQVLNEDEALSQVVIRLLEPHVGSRIVLAGGSL